MTSGSPTAGTDLAADHLAPFGHLELGARALRGHSLELSEQGRVFFTKVVLARSLHRMADLAHVAEAHDTIGVLQRQDSFCQETAG